MTQAAGDPLGIKSRFAELQRRGHPGLAIAVAAILDTQLEQCLKHAMRPLPKKVYEDLFDPMRALGSFASKITMAYALRIISREIYLELEKVRRIRNGFAHSSNLLHFDSESIAPLFAQLKASTQSKSTSPSQQFLECIKPIDKALAAYLNAERQEVGGGADAA
jgi:DNA-binding MltR family transcriptional regulator